MTQRFRSKLNPKLRYLQVALNSSLEEAKQIIQGLPVSDRILLEAGTPLIKRYGISVVGELARAWYYRNPLALQSQPNLKTKGLLGLLVNQLAKAAAQANKGELGILPNNIPAPYIVADLKTIDRGATEVELAAQAGASAAVAMGSAPTETLNSFIAACEANHLDAMIDMMNVEYPLAALRALKRLPPVVILHRGVDEERDNKEKQIPLHEIRRIKGAFDMMIAIAGGDTIREIQRSIFNDADIVREAIADKDQRVELRHGQQRAGHNDK